MSGIFRRAFHGPYLDFGSEQAAATDLASEIRASLYYIINFLFLQASA